MARRPDPAKTRLRSDRLKRFSNSSQTVTDMGRVTGTGRPAVTFIYWLAASVPVTPTVTHACRPAASRPTSAWPPNGPGKRLLRSTHGLPCCHSACQGLEDHWHYCCCRLRHTPMLPWPDFVRKRTISWYSGQQGFS